MFKTDKKDKFYVAIKDSISNPNVRKTYSFWRNYGFAPLCSIRIMLHYRINGVSYVRS